MALVESWEMIELDPLGGKGPGTRLNRLRA